MTTFLRFINATLSLPAPFRKRSGPQMARGVVRRFLVQKKSLRPGGPLKVFLPQSSTLLKTCWSDSLRRPFHCGGEVTDDSKHSSS